MSRLEQLFKEKNERVLNVYCTAGYPNLSSTLSVMSSLQANGANIIEIGMPYSDPLADGEVIQTSSIKALANGMTLTVLFEQLANMRKSINIPVILMGYMNPILQYGFEAFCKKAKEVGVDGLILPDLPLFEFEQFYGKIIKDNGLNFIFLVTPETPAERIKKLDKWILDKKSHLWTHYRMTIEDYQSMLKSQNGKCKICNKNKRLVVDHDHSCCLQKNTCGNCVRGLLCFSCNTLVGYIEINKNLIKSVDFYLQGL